MIMKLTGDFLAYLMQFIIFMTVVFSLVTGNFFVSISGAIALFLSFLPYFFERKTHIIIPWWATFFIALSLYLHIAGYSQGWYESLYPYYDKFAHLIASMTVAILMFLLVLILNRYGNIRFSRIMIFFTVFLFTLALGSIWESLEYIIDQIFGNRLHFSTMLQHGLDDTMSDLLSNLIGGLIVAAVGTWYLKRVDGSVIVDGFVKEGKEAYIPRLTHKKNRDSSADAAIETTCLDPSSTDMHKGIE
jgi:hypothetical protein